MIKKLTKTGNSLALVLDKPLLDQAKIDADTPSRSPPTGM
jgi:antitoxin component of MazEF toxin-antitoxin module